jgi:hypothetical protein
MITTARDPVIQALFYFWGISLCTFILYYFVRRFSSGSTEVG